ncbi:ribosome maturation factor RimM [Actinokineospora guangxiensis]|uniref:Ribosome maturation factor RimM n=1 Tax=Actinokineospora guangxiensis TaxID=1490288 RepID=A0ABW0EWP7_9PSEU
MAEVVVGRVAKAHGIRGELAVEVRTDAPELRFAEGASVDARLKDGAVRALTIAAARWHTGRLLVRFDQVPDRDDAERLRGALLLADPEGLPEPSDPEEFRDHDLIGLAAVLADGTVLGRVADVQHGPGGELLVVARESGADVLVPFVTAIVPEVDIAGGRVVLDPPEGLIE